MSLWKRLQRVGKKAAKFQFTASLEELNVTFNKNYTLNSIIVVLMRRGRRCTSKAITLRKALRDDSIYDNVWSVPENLQIVTTLYRNEKDINFEEKEWTFQVEDVGMSAEAFNTAVPSATMHRRVLATRQVNVSEFASMISTQTNLKINLRAASKKITSVTLLFTLHGLMLKAGEATDEDMLSLASMMSLSRASSFGLGSHSNINEYFGRALPLSNENGTVNYQADLSSFSTKLQDLVRCSSGTKEHEEGDSRNSPQKIRTDGELFKLSPLEGKNTYGNKIASSTPTQVSEPLPTRDLALVPSMVSQTEQDLLSWCQEVTKGYPNVRISDFSSSFMSGLAFCAILHHFCPESIDFNILKATDQLENVRLAFDAAAKLGIPRVIDPSEIVSSKGTPDRLSIMTYLHQFRMHFSQLSITRKSTILSNNQSSTPIPTSIEEISHTNCEKDGEHGPKKKKNELPKEIETSKNVASSARYEQLLAKARTLLLESRSKISLPADRCRGNSENPSSSSADEIPSSQTSPECSPLTANSSVRFKRLKLSNLKLFSDSLDKSVHCLMPENHTDYSETQKSAHNSFSMEQSQITHEQELLDTEAPELEKRLRDAMAKGENSADEEILMRRWFTLVNKKNALLLRSYQLSIMEKEKDLQETTEIIKQQLHELIAKEDSLKTDADRQKEEQLLHKVVKMVNERDDIIKELDHQEQALADEVELGLLTDKITHETFQNNDSLCLLQ